jgi:hypothetical protein
VRRIEIASELRDPYSKGQDVLAQGYPPIWTTPTAALVTLAIHLSTPDSATRRFLKSI